MKLHVLILNVLKNCLKLSCSGDQLHDIVELYRRGLAASVFLIRITKETFIYTRDKSLLLCVLDLVFTYVKHLELIDVTTCQSQVDADPVTNRTTQGEAAAEALQQLRNTNCIVMEWLLYAVMFDFNYTYAVMRSLGEELQVLVTHVCLIT